MALGTSRTGAGITGASGSVREGNEGGSLHVGTEQSAFDELHCFIIHSVVGLLSQFSQQVNNKTLDLFRIDKRKKNWTDKGDHCYVEIDLTDGAFSFSLCVTGSYKRCNSVGFDLCV